MSRHPTHARAPVAPGVAVGIGLGLAMGATLTGCGQVQHHLAGADPTISAWPTPVGATPHGTTVRVHITGDSVDPAGSLIYAHRGKPVTLIISAARAGRIDVRTKPEQFVSYPRGTSAARLHYMRPGVIDVESYTLRRLILQLEVR